LIAEEVQKIGGRRERGCWGVSGRRLFPSPARDAVFLEGPVRPETLSPFLEIRIAGFDDFGESEGAHDFADLNWRHVLREVGHPDAPWWGRWRDISLWARGLAFGDGGDWGSW